MSVKLSDFASGVTLTDTDHVVGYSNTNTGGERKWTVANLRNSLITGAATTIDTENLTASRALISNASGKIDVSTVTSTELNALDGISTTATIQTQLNGKGPGTVTSVTGTAPISVATGTTTPAISIAAATTSSAGSMSSTDKTRLNDASAVNGIIKCNGSGNFSAAVAGTDYLTTSGAVKAYGAIYWTGDSYNTNPAAGFQWLESFNVASITWIQGGVYKVTFTNAMTNNRYCVVGNVNLPYNIFISPYTGNNWYNGVAGRNSMEGNENSILVSNKETTDFYICVHSNEGNRFENTNGFSFIVI